MIQSRLSSHIRPHARSSNDYVLSSGIGNRWMDENESLESAYLPTRRGLVESGSENIGFSTLAKGVTSGLEDVMDTDSPMASQLAQVEKERATSKAYIRSQMQFLMVLASSTEAETVSEAGGRGYLHDDKGLSPQSVSPREAHTYASTSGESPSRSVADSSGDNTSKSMAYQAVSMLKSQSHIGGVTGSTTTKTNETTKDETQFASISMLQSSLGSQDA